MVWGGLTLIVAPVPTGDPFPHPPTYHFQEAFVPNDPPVTFRVVLAPLQIMD